MTEFRLTGGQVLGTNGLEARALAVVQGVIADDIARRDVDITGFWVLPGIVDVHGDGFERHLAPRRGAVRNLGAGLRACDAELGASGITTAMLAQFFSWEGGMRGPDFATRLLDALGGAGMLTDVRTQLRFETHLLDDYRAFEDLVARHQVPYVVFNDHLPHGALLRGKRPPRLTGQALKSGRSPDAHLALLQQLHDNRADVPEALAALANRLVAKGVLLGSHDENSAEGWQKARAMGVGVSEFPETLEAAQAARDSGAFIVMGAPNVVRGGSHGGNISAEELVVAGLCDALASDYHYPALMQAVLDLWGKSAGPLEALWALVSENPARLLGLDDRGRLEAGKRADLVILDAQSHRVCGTFCNGQATFLSGGLAARFMA